MAIRRPPTTFSDSITGHDLASDIAISTTGNIATTGSGTLTVVGTTTVNGVLHQILLLVVIQSIQVFTDPSENGNSVDGQNLQE